MKASARIQVTLDVPLADVWQHDGDDHNVGEVFAEIRTSAIAAMKRQLDPILRGNGGIRVVGDPKVTIVLVEDV